MFFSLLFYMMTIIEVPAPDTTAMLEREAIKPVKAAHAPYGVWDRLAECESNGDWSINTGNGFEGGIQFVRSTWLWMGGDDFAPAAHLATREEQIIVAERLVAYEQAQGRGGYNPWPSCADQLGLPR